VRIARPLATLMLAAGCLSKPSFDCPVAPGPAQTEPGIGSNGGVPLGSADCGDRSVVGLGFTLTRETIPSQRTVITATLRCATVSYRGRYETGATEEVRVPGGSEKDVDGPFFGDCPDGHVVTGLAAHLVGNGGRFNSIVVKCAALDLMGRPVGDITEIPVTETGSEPSKVSADCRADEVLYGLEAKGGRELDQVALRCTQPSCKP
jgi:hypothetical protein